MKEFTTLGQFTVLMTLEETSLVEEIRKSGGLISRKSLTERQKQIAKNAVSKGILNRSRNLEGSVYYALNEGRIPRSRI